MSKIWIMSSVAAVAMTSAMVWGAQPARSSQDWLTKAQSEFATKGRDALIQRRMTKVMGHGAAPIEDQAADNGFDNTSTEPAETRTAALAPVEAADKPVVTRSSETIEAAPTTSKTGETVASTEVKTADAKTADTMTAEIAIGPQPVDAAVPTPEPETAPAQETAPSAVVPVKSKGKHAVQSTTVAAANPRAAAPTRTHPSSNQSATVRTVRRSEPGVSIDARSMATLRARAPEIAAMIGRYM